MENFCRNHRGLGNKTISATSRVMRWLVLLVSFNRTPLGVLILSISVSTSFWLRKCCTIKLSFATPVSEVHFLNTNGYHRKKKKLLKQWLRITCHEWHEGNGMHHGWLTEGTTLSRNYIANSKNVPLDPNHPISTFNTEKHRILPCIHLKQQGGQKTSRIVCSNKIF